MSRRSLHPETRIQLAADEQSQVPLSAARKRFNGLVKRLDNCRTRLHAWNEALPRWRERYLQQAAPLLQQRDALDIELLYLLDHAHAAHKLGKAERAFLSGLICDLAGPRVAAGQEQLKPLYDRHSEVGFDEELAESDALMKQAIGAHFGLDQEAMAGIDSPEDLLQQLRARAQQEPQAHTRQRSERARAGRAQRRTTQGGQAAAAAPQPLRELYRKLATALHPDREPDPAERERKTALMQRLNQAYGAGNLLALIELQLEIGQLRPEQLQQMSQARIEDYNRDLNRQLRDMERELAQVEHAFRSDYGVVGGNRLKPERLDGLLAQIKRQLADEIQRLQYDLQDLQQPALFKRWLKREREYARGAHAFDGAPW